MARFIFISPPSTEELEARLRKSTELTEEALQAQLKAAQDDVAFAQSKTSYDVTITNDNLEDAYRELETFIYGTLSEETNGVNGSEEDVAMKESSTNGEPESAVAPGT